MRTLRTLSTLAASLALAALVGCGGEPAEAPTTPSGSGSASPAPATPGKPRIALIMKSLANEFFAVMAEGAKTYQKEHADRFDLIVNGIKDERDIARQVSLVDEMIGQKVAAIVIAPADSKALVSACRRAQEAGIVVVNIDNKLDEAVLVEQGVKIPFVGPDNRAGARLAGDLLASKLKPGDPVAIVEGLKTAFNGQQRLLGFQDAAKAADLKIVDSQSAQWEIAQANRVASAMLSEHPEIKALMCCNDSMALGALAAVKAAGRSGQVQIIGYDGIAAVRTAIDEGAILATIDQHADQLAVFGLECALDVIDKKETPADRTTPVDLVVKK
ncbi:sugar ABC transporter substrate-binding protein [Planctomyces sp. SH-PL62]|uniref:sugar ABC transporter substrate-binding protein n=1 Tax=Planctomyces sp. SH-PL62 TaxID=1636152 RepID=UPI00078E453A|nr:sugar ABC transporter substrate-binding protein [Planctomyces sp. SH-PL62]AMV39737.1 D-ribose-binding periplasmic protein precursor [Planctomyces sp. SH-PL62]